MYFNDIMKYPELIFLVSIFKYLFVKFENEIIPYIEYLYKNNKMIRCNKNIVVITILYGWIIYYFHNQRHRHVKNLPPPGMSSLFLYTMFNLYQLLLHTHKHCKTYKLKFIINNTQLPVSVNYSIKSNVLKFTI